MLTQPTIDTSTATTPDDVDDAIRRLIATAPPLTAAQRDKIASLAHAR